MNKDLREDRRAWIRSALSEYEQPLTRYAARITGDAEAARDVVQEVFLRLCREDAAQLNGKLAPWLFSVCRNRALDVRRKDARMQVGIAEPNATQHTTHADPATLAERKEGTSQVLSLVDTLPPNQQEVIRLRFQNGLRYKEIAEVAGLTVTNVGYLIHTAVKTIRTSLADDGRGASR